MSEKTEILKTNVKYYGQRCQVLLEAIVERKRYDPATGLRNTLQNTVQQLGIDSEKIKFNPETEEFD